MNCILDSTFAYGGAQQNIERSLRHERRVEIWFVYQDPLRAWEFTKAREASETRRINKNVFIKGFFESRANAYAVKELFGKKIELNILIKDYAAGTKDFYLNVPATKLDQLTNDRYSVDNLNKLLI